MGLPLLKDGVQTQGEGLRFFWGAQEKRQMGGGAGGGGSGSVEKLQPSHQEREEGSVTGACKPDNHGQLPVNSYHYIEQNV